MTNSILFAAEESEACRVHGHRVQRAHAQEDQDGGAL